MFRHGLLEFSSEEQLISSGTHTGFSSTCPETKLGTALWMLSLEHVDSKAVWTFPGDYLL